jgi:hypothetical protein
MFKKLVEWLNSLWPTPIDDFVGGIYEDEYETLIKNKYGIADAWADTEEDDCRT